MLGQTQKRLLLGLKNKASKRQIYLTIQEAFSVYKIEKEKYIKELANEYYLQGKITQKVYDAMNKYEVEIND